MAQADNIESIISSLAASINQNLVIPSEKRFKEIDNQAQHTEKKIYSYLNEIESSLDELRTAHKRLGILCICLSIAFIVNIIVQLL
ncbi:MAG: hypothetical protein K9L17_09815 [Clostridiales bacterium]|nr:hypothetical protein [Clostridiales bacterium]MCF8022976.1 hypothetical protein [Clostridiales bacterium]